MKRILYIAMSLLAVTMVACSEDSQVGEVDLGYLELISANTGFSFDGGSGEIVVDTTLPVTATMAADGGWATTSVNGNVVTVTVPAYAGLLARNSSVLITAGDRSVIVPISQTSVGVVLSPNSATVAKEGGQMSFSYSLVYGTISIDPSFMESFSLEAVSDQPWVTCAIDGNVITLTVAAYTDYLNPRNASITLRSSDGILGPTFGITQQAPLISELTRADLNAMTWSVWANGAYSSAVTGTTTVKTLSTAGNSLFRIDSPIVPNQHFYFAWDSANEGNYLLPAADMTLGGLPTQFTGAGIGGLPLYWRTDPDPAWTFFDAASRTFNINSEFLTISTEGAVTSYGWLDDSYVITE